MVGQTGMNFIKTLQSLSLARQLMLGAAVLGVVAAMTFMVRGAMQPPMALLYSGLEPTHAGEIIEELEQRDVKYEIRSGAIFVSAPARDRVRFDLAQQGLPKQAIKGYELLDDVNGFSVTSEMYNASYWRAKEGELTRTILAIPGVQAARVHIGASLRSGFSRHRSSQTASVTLSASRDLSQNQAEAIQYLVALAVAGLNPDDVAVIDSRYGILAGPNVDKSAQPAAVAEDQSKAMEDKILRLLTARVGEGNAEVSVSVDVTRARELVSSVQFDPDSRVIRQRTSNDISESREGGNGALTVASNLPQEGGQNAGGATSTVKNSTESVAYELNELRRETETLPGEIRRVSVAVLLNQDAIEFANDQADIAQALEEISAEFEQLIASAAGLDFDRGDTIAVELMPFKQPIEEELITPPGLVSQLMERHLWSAIQAILLGLVVIVLGVFVIRPMFRAAPAGETEEAEGTTTVTRLETDPIEYLKEYTRERETETAAILQEWLNEDQKQAVNE